MKIDNFELLESLLFDNLDKKTSPKTDKVVLGRIIRRRKENPGDSRPDFIVKRYTFSTKERFLERKEEIKKLCELFNARFYVAITIKSMKSIAFDMAEALPKMLRLEQYYYTRRMFDNIGDANKGLKEYRLWIYDIDNKDHEKPIIEYLINNGDFANYVKAIVPTINGVHILVKPHDIRNIQKDKILVNGEELNIYDIIDIKKNAMTLCYYSDEGEQFKL